MLNAQTHKRSRTAPGRTVSAKTPNNIAPPVIVAAPEPHPIFGSALRIPGFDLQKQPVHMLVFWLKKARAIIDRVIAEGPPSDEVLGDALTPFNEIFDAIISAKTNSAADVEKQMQAVVDYLDWFQSDVIEEAITMKQFRVIASNLKRATAPLQPNKRIGSLVRGRKLTRAGLLFRYQSFLIQELQTLSYELYGERDFATTFIAYDDEVSARCKSRGQSYPFFNPRKLTGRARSVLRSLKINTKDADGKALRLSGKGGSR